MMINRWQKVDDFTKVLVAATASGSAVAGWALWQRETLKIFWAVIAGLGALLAIAHAALGVTGRLKEWGECKRHFANLRIELETFRERMALDPNFDFQKFEEEFLSLKRKYAEGVQLLPSDIMLSWRLENITQHNINRRLADQIQDTKQEAAQ
jgi:hypothetical protein